jgi:large repetitive protein
MRRFRFCALGATILATALVLVSGTNAQEPTPDTTPPVVTVPGPITAEATSSSGAVVSFAVSANDNVDGPVAATCSHASGATFPLGATTVSCTATDAATNTGTGEFQVTVADTMRPALTLPANITAEATSPAGASVSYSASATDTVAGSVPVTCSPAPGTFPLGATAVECSASDGANTATGSFQVTVRDTQGPTVAVPAPIEVGTNGSNAVVNFTVTATDVVDGALTPTCSPASGSTFNIGTTTVTCSVADTRGNPGSGSFTVSVRDAAAPTLSVPGNITTEATSASGAAVSFNVTATDNIDPSVTVSCSRTSGAMFPIGNTRVDCTATDDSGNTSSDSFQVRVRDTQAPTVTVPTPIEVGTNGLSAVVSFTVTASDAVDGTLTPTCSHASGSAFGIGTTTVTCTAIDASRNSGSGSFTVTVRDAAPPALNLPANVTADATSAAGRVVTFSASASDVVDGARPVTCSPISGSTFRIGRTTVTCTARDAAGNNASGSFVVTITDAAPTITVPPKHTVEATGPSGAKVTFAPAPVGADTVDGALLAGCSPASGATFPLGTTSVTCTTTDSTGSSASGSFEVQVVDTTPPVVTAPPAATFAAEGGSLSRSSPALAAYLARGRIGDLVDMAPTLYVEAPQTFPLGETVVRYVGVDASGNTATMTTTITIVPPPPPGQRVPPPPAPDPPPGNVSSLRATPGNRLVRLRWNAPADQDVARYAAFRSERNGTPSQVYSGAARTFTDRGLVNGTEYRYIVVAYDRAGNRSVGVAVLATPQLPMLLLPRDGARLTRPTVFSWRRVADARFYNLQLFRATGPGRLQKVLSVWPVTNRFALQSSWKFGGRTFRLTPGTYRWYVWPGFGSRADAQYGALLGQRSFVVSRRR